MLSLPDALPILPADEIEIVLQPFGQVESAHTRSHDGTGLGLPITKSLAEMHGGSMTVESAVDKGSTITVRFPASRVGRASLLAAAARRSARRDRKSTRLNSSH